MNALIFLVALGALGGAGYEFYLQQQAQQDYVQKRAADLPQIAQLSQQTIQLEQDNAAVTRSLSAMHSPGSSR